MWGIIRHFIWILVCVRPAATLINLQDDVMTPCGSCTCRSAQAISDCSNKQLNTVPNNLPSNTTELNLSRNNITDFSKVRLCEVYPGLKKLSLAWNSLKSVAGIFKGCNRLEELDLTGNVLEFLDPSAFEDIGNLQELVSVEVEELPQDLFHNLKKLQTLNLTGYGIKIQTGVFYGLSSLKMLTLSLEKVTTLPDNLLSFNGSNVLKSLVLRGSKVRDVPGEFLAELVNLKYLHLDLPQLLELRIKKDMKPKHLQVVEISNVRSLADDIFSGLQFLDTVKLSGIGILGNDLFKTASTVKELKIVGCSLRELPSGWLSKMVALETLNLSDNDIERLSHDDFSHLTSLKHLALSSNRIQDVPDGFLSSQKAMLRQLLMNDNRLRRLKPDMFADMQVLEVIELSKNTIRNVAADSFRNLPQLRVLRLASNFIGSLDNVMFKWFPVLKEVDLTENMISEFPETLLASNVESLFMNANNLENLPVKKLCQMSTLMYLSLEDNPIACDCSLHSLHRCLPHLRIEGKCLDQSSLEGKDINEIPACLMSLTTSQPSAQTSTNVLLSAMPSQTLSASDLQVPAPLNVTSTLNSLYQTPKLMTPTFWSLIPSSSTSGSTSQVVSSSAILIPTSSTPSQMLAPVSDMIVTTVEFRFMAHPSASPVPLPPLTGDTDYEEIVRELTAMGPNIQFASPDEVLPSPSVTEQVPPSETLEANYTDADLENITDMDFAENDSESRLQDFQTYTSPPHIAQVQALPSKSNTEGYTGLLGLAGDITLGVILSLASLVGVLGGVWFYRKYFQSGSYNAASPSGELPHQTFQPVVVEQGHVPNQKRSKMTVECSKSHCHDPY